MDKIRNSQSHQERGKVKKSKRRGSEGTRGKGVPQPHAKPKNTELMQENVNNET